MSRDGKGSNRTDTGGTPPWVWMLTGFVLGIVLSLAVYLKGGGRIDGSGTGDGRAAVDETGGDTARRDSWISGLFAVFRSPGNRGTERGETGAVHRDSAESAGDRRDFEFYTLLPDLEVTIPDEGGTPLARDPVKATRNELDSRVAPSPDDSGRYMLQAGSFTQFSEADGLRARLALIGVEASIREVTVGNTVFHRVRVGPYRDYSDAARIQKILKHNRVESLLMKSGG